MRVHRFITIAFAALMTQGQISAAIPLENESKERSRSTLGGEDHELLFLRDFDSDVHKLVIRGQGYDTAKEVRDWIFFAVFVIAATCHVTKEWWTKTDKGQHTTSGKVETTLATVQRSNALLDACKRGDLALVRPLALSFYDNDHQETQSRIVPPIQTLLCAAARNGRSDVIRFFFDKIPACRDDPDGMPWNSQTDPYVHFEDVLKQWYRDNWPNTVVRAAAHGGNHEVLQTLLDYGMHVDAAPERQNTSFETALYRHDFSLAEFLLSRGAAIYGNGEPLGSNSVRDAAESGDIESLQFLLDHGATLDNTNALEGAAQTGCIPAAEFLLKVGANIDEIFVPMYCSPDDKDEGICSALHTAIKWEQPDFVDFLLRQGANKNIRDAVGQTPAQLAEKLDRWKRKYEHQKIDAGPQNRCPTVISGDVETGTCDGLVPKVVERNALQKIGDE
ncbi:hypothetical protein ANO11243_091430 [Dothideomycetidae sp. 11243]|nr:hypothetical protein ANO11243_091430 [fungal sp. No.11243]